MSFQRESYELISVCFGIRFSSELFQILPDHLIHARSERLCALAGKPNGLVVYRKREVHARIIRAHVIRVNRLTNVG
jgi:hypothetical protein